jgi:uncharacterized protein
MNQFYLPLLGGLMIGVSAVWLMAVNGRIAGISGIAAGLIRAPFAPDGRWRVAFLLGLLLGPLAAMAFAGHGLIGAPAATRPVLIAAGLLTGLGTALGGGCTSGHGVCGMARLAPRSIAATLIFMAVAVATVFVMRHVI